MDAFRRPAYVPLAQHAWPYRLPPAPAGLLQSVFTVATLLGSGGGDLLRHIPRPSSGSGGVSERIVIDPEAVLECFRISESGPALAGPVPTPPMYLRR